MINKVSNPMIKNPIIISIIFIIMLTLPTSIYGNITEIEKLVKKMGSTPDPLVEIKILCKCPKESVPLLIKELHPISVARILNWEKKPNAEHVLWCIRALRFITGGKDFCAPTRYRFGKGVVETRRKAFLHHRDPHCLPFFVLWSSYCSHYIAPLDTQKAIIKKWKEWYEKEGKFADLKPLVNPKPQDWSW
jgi:hypothetical protein